MTRRVWLLALAVMAAVFSASLCFGTAPSFAADEAMVLPVDPEPLVIETSGGDKRFSIEVADETEERTRGLMFRTTMPEDRGMLFVFEAQQLVGFWMKNTPMPLDLIFIGQDGVIRDIEPGEPFSEATIAAGEPVRFVLELKAGTAAKAGIAEGDKVRHPAVDAAPMPANPG